MQKFKSSWPKTIVPCRNEIRYQSDLLRFLQCRSRPKLLTCYVRRMLRRTQGDSKQPFPRHMHAITQEKLGNAICRFDLLTYSRNSAATDSMHYATHLYLQAKKVPILNTYLQDRADLKTNDILKSSHCYTWSASDVDHLSEVRVNLHFVRYRTAVFTKDGVYVLLLLSFPSIQALRRKLTQLIDKSG